MERVSFRPAPKPQPWKCPARSGSRLGVADKCSVGMGSYALQALLSGLAAHVEGTGSRVMVPGLPIN